MSAKEELSIALNKQLVSWKVVGWLAGAFIVGAYIFGHLDDIPVSESQLAEYCAINAASAFVADLNSKERMAAKIGKVTNVTYAPHPTETDALLVKYLVTFSVSSGPYSDIETSSLRTACFETAEALTAFRKK